ncbi:extracellular solute-binding protein [Candidatus Finniella inopinata]|uniref:sn-glycerol-3-phosphate-binding periplasmic protein UgpB n=1 Tax=Candidatus Finniella inopinata TaxID=1696036 RepID=A0A4Q7DJA3_9PROT|nr:extracellular solute-binding protein [Candidatus Finniella inopinata]RZI46420.1 extracellular solute-binding protein [Candidatus Finniella inopinata]
MFIKPFFMTALLCLVTIQNCNSEKITVWHGFAGELGIHFQKIIDVFNQSLKREGSAFEIEVELKGSYDDVVKSYLSASKETRPDIVQAYEMATRSMLGAKDPAGHAVYIPIRQIMQHAGLVLDEDSFLTQVILFYKAGGAQFVSVPFNISTVVLYYNKTALNNTKLKPIITFEEFDEQMEKLKSAGEPAGMGAGWLSGHQIDQIGGRHNKQIATYGNGVDSPDARLFFDRFFTFHFKALRDWSKKGWFSLEQGPKAEQAFADRKIVYLTNGGNRHSDIAKLVNGKFEIGVTAFPYWRQAGSPFNTISGGGSFWVANKPQSCERMKVIAQFLNYLVTPEVQAQWQRMTGYVPVVKKAYEINVKEGFFDSTDLGVQAAKIAYDSFTTNQPGTFSRGILLDSFPGIRKIEVQQMEKCIKGEISAEDAIKTIESEGNKLLDSKNS